MGKFDYQGRLSWKDGLLKKQQKEIAHAAEAGPVQAHDLVDAEIAAADRGKIETGDVYIIDQSEEATP
jgi:uncharacterized protein HemY